MSLQRTMGTLALAAGVLAVSPAAAWACPVCFQATEQNRMAFLGTTAFLTFLPLLVIGGAIYFLRKRFLARQGETTLQRDPASTTVDPEPAQ